MTPRTRLALLALAAAAIPAAAAPTAHADVTITGRGFGHGVGLSQYGAYGYALRQNKDAGWMLGHYYPGTYLGRAPASRMRVLLKASPSVTVCSATKATAGGRRVKLAEAASYRVRKAPGGRLRLVDARNDRTKATLRTPVRISGGDGTCLRGKALSGRRDGEYAGAMQFVRDGADVLAINDVTMADYLKGVVPAEMPSSWPIEALKAQAIVARSYALRALRPTKAFDVYADTRSQVYAGRAGEAPQATAAVLATEPTVVMHQGAVAQTFFSSTSGGQTASNEEAFGGTPIPYLRSVIDAEDDISPVHTWTETFPAQRAESKLGDLVKGSLTGLQVTKRGPSGRAQSVEVSGSQGTTTATAAQIRARLDLRSTWFQISPGT